MIGRFSNLGVTSRLLRSRDFLRIAGGGILALIAYLMDMGKPEPSLAGNIMALGSVAVNGFPIILGAVRGILRRQVNVDELVSLAIVAGLWMGEYLTAAVIGFVMVLGSLIEEATADSARKAIETLMNMVPENASVVRDGRVETVPVENVRIDDVLLIKPGERIPVDGIVLVGMTAVDESSMTGEPIPREKKPRDAVYAGTLNQNGVIEMKVTQVGEKTALGKVVRLVSEAERHKPQAVRAVDRFAHWFTPTILACAAGTWFLTGDAHRAITVLIVGCPCALILAAPTAVVATLGRAAKAGILVKGGIYLEEAGRAKVVLFDKTGTLTEGNPNVDAIATTEGLQARDVLARAACVEQNSTHPLARAVMRAAHYAKVTVVRAEDMFMEIGLGVRAFVKKDLIEVGSAYIGGGSARLPLPLRESLERFKDEGRTPLVVYENHRPIGIISVADQVRPSAHDTVRELRSLGIEHVGVVSGDHRKSTSIAAEKVGIDLIRSGLKPEDKPGVVQEFQEKNMTVVFVGDGINDAPALARADVGIAMGGVGTHVALETADVVLMNDDIGKIPFLIKLGRRMLTVIKWNIAFGMTFNAVAVVAGGGGYLSPIMGAIVHNIGSVLVVLSSASMAFVSRKLK